MKRGMEQHLKEGGRKNGIRHFFNTGKPRRFWSALLILVLLFGAVFFLQSERKEPQGGASEETVSGSVSPDVLKNVYTQAVEASDSYNGGTASYTYAADYDGDGKEEAFVAVGNLTSGHLLGDLYFVSADLSCTHLSDLPYLQQAGQEYLEQNGQRFLFFRYEMGETGATDVWTVRNGAAENALPYYGYKYITEEGQVICVSSDYHGSYLAEEDFWSQFTVTYYPFQLKNGYFEEIPARVVTEEELAELSENGKTNFSKESSAASGNAVTEKQYIYRENGELNVNFATVTSSGIDFSYKTYRLTEQGTFVFIEQGQGYYQVSLAEEDSEWVEELFLTYGFLAEDGSVPEWTESYRKPNPVVGEPYVPDEDMLAHVKTAEDFTDSYRWYYEFPLWVWADEGNVEKIHSDENLYLIGKTEGFSLYTSCETELLLVETPDGNFICSDMCITSNYKVQPAPLEQDFDGDGENELAVETLTMHGTGICIMSLYMADRAADGQWYLYECLSSEYLAQLGEHYDTVQEENGVRLVLDGKSVGLPAKTEKARTAKNYQYLAGNQIDFLYEGEKIVIQAELVGCAEDEISVNGDYPGHIIRAEVLYHGEGVWELAGFRYADCNLESRAEVAIYEFFRDDRYKDSETAKNAMNLTFAAEGFSFAENENRYPLEEIEILSITYPSPDWENGEALVTAEVRLGGSDSLDYITMKMQAVPEEAETYGTVDEWRIADWAMEK